MISPPLSDRMILNFVSVRFSTIEIHVTNILYTSDFALIAYIHEYNDYSPIKLKNTAIHF